jgi:L-lactate utilization protein LutC
MYSLTVCYTDKHSREGDVEDPVYYSKKKKVLIDKMYQLANAEVLDILSAANVTEKTKKRLKTAITKIMQKKKRKHRELDLSTKSFENVDDKDYIHWKSRTKRISISFYEDYGFETMKYKIQEMIKL